MPELGYHIETPAYALYRGRLYQDIIGDDPCIVAVSADLSLLEEYILKDTVTVKDDDDGEVIYMHPEDVHYYTDDNPDEVQATYFYIKELDRCSRIKVISNKV